MKKGKNLLALVLCVAMCYVPMQAAGYYKTKNVLYGGVQLYYNGTYQNATAQAVLIDGTTYLPVRALGNMLGLSLDWNQNTNTVSITGITDTVLSAQAQLRAKDYQIAALTKELEQLKKQGVVSSVTSSNDSSNRYETTSGTNILGTEITDTRKALDNEYGAYFDDIDFDFSLSLSSSKLRLTIEIDDSSDYREFNKLSRSEVKEFLKEVCEEVRDRHDDIAITGTIKYTNGSKTLYSFAYSKRDDLSYSIGSYSYNSYYDEDELLDIVEDTTYVRIKGYDERIDVEKVKVNVNDNRERIIFTLYLDLDESDMKEAWNNNIGTNHDSILKEYLEDIADDLAYETDYDDIQGVLKDYDTDKEIGTYDYEDNKLILYSI